MKASSPKSIQDEGLLILRVHSKDAPKCKQTTSTSTGMSTYQLMQKKTPRDRYFQDMLIQWLIKFIREAFFPFFSILSSSPHWVESPFTSQRRFCRSWCDSMYHRIQVRRETVYSLGFLLRRKRSFPDALQLISRQLELIYTLIPKSISDKAVGLTKLSRILPLSHGWRSEHANKVGAFKQGKKETGFWEVNAYC